MARFIGAFLAESDAAALFRWLSDDCEIAFLWHDEGKEQRNLAIDAQVKAIPLTVESMDQRDRLLHSAHWKAYRQLVPQGDRTYMLWHMPSGPIYRDSDIRGTAWDVLNDPWSGWTGPSSGSNRDAPAMPDLPYFLSVGLRTRVPAHKEMVGLSSIAMHGARHEAAPMPMKKFWTRLKRYLSKSTVEVPGNGIDSSKESRFPCFSGALAEIQRREPAT